MKADPIFHMVTTRDKRRGTWDVDQYGTVKIYASSPQQYQTTLDDYRARDQAEAIPLRENLL